MKGRTAIRALAGTIAVVASATIVSIAAPPASATTTPLTGSIIYDKSGNIFLTNGVTTRQVTTDGGRATSDRTGSSGYITPSESDNGVIVAIRNQHITDPGYDQGWLWVMDRNGHVIRKFKPAQFSQPLGTTACPAVPAQMVPRGLFNAEVSPDGKWVAYTAWQYYHDPVWCDVRTAFQSYIVKIDGTGGKEIAETNRNTASIEIGQWASATRLLVDNGAFGSVADEYVDVPDATAHSWSAAPCEVQGQYQEPDMQNGILATVGFYADCNGNPPSGNAVELWSTSGFTSPPTGRCVTFSGVDSNDWLSQPSLAPDASSVVYEDANADGTLTKSSQGVYLLSTSIINQGCTGSPTLLVAGAADPGWSAASIYGPPAVRITSHPANPTPSRSATIGLSATNPYPAPGAGPLTITCRIDGAAPHSCGSSVSYAGLADGVHTVTVTASDGAQSSSATYSWRIDTTRPAVTLTAPTAAAIAATSVNNNWKGTDAGSGIASYQQQIQRAPFSGGFGAWANLGRPWSPSVTKTTISALGGGNTYCLRVKAVDRAGNAGYSAPRCFAVALDDRAQSPSSGWKRITGSAYYARTATSTTRKGATLTRTRASLDRVGLVAKTCRGCGTVGVYVGSTLIGRLSLAAASTHYRAVLLLPRFRGRSGTVTVKVLTSGRPVTLDGVVISRA
jgi:hypothetical protein